MYSQRHYNAALEVNIDQPRNRKKLQSTVLVLSIVTAVLFISGTVGWVMYAVDHTGSSPSDSPPSPGAPGAPGVPDSPPSPGAPGAPGVPNSPPSPGAPGAPEVHGLPPSTGSFGVLQSQEITTFPLVCHPAAQDCPKYVFGLTVVQYDCFETDVPETFTCGFSVDEGCGGNCSPCFESFECLHAFGALSTCENNDCTFVDDGVIGAGCDSDDECDEQLMCRHKHVGDTSEGDGKRCMSTAFVFEQCSPVNNQGCETGSCIDIDTTTMQGLCST